MDNTEIVNVPHSRRNNPGPSDNGIDYAVVIGLKSLGGGILTSLDMTKPGDKKLLMGAMMGECQKAEDHINSEMLVTDVVLCPASSTDPNTGDLDTWTRCVLLLADGSRVSFGSAGILKSLWLYSLCYTKPPWIPPAKMRLKSTAVGKNRWYTLEPIDDAKPTTKPAK